MIPSENSCRPTPQGIMNYFGTSACVVMAFLIWKRGYRLWGTRRTVNEALGICAHRITAPGKLHCVSGFKSRLV